MAPIRVRFTSIFTNITSTFANNLGSIACEFTTLYSIIFHGVIITCMCFFFEIPPFEELQEPGSSPRREEVGCRTLRGYGGFLLPVFYRARFRFVHESKSIPIKKRGWEASVTPGSATADFLPTRATI